MIGAGTQAAGFNKPQPLIMQSTHFPAPNKGVDTRAAISDMNLENCIYTFNLVPNDFGMSVRSGYREWCIDLDNGGAVGGIRTIMVFDGSVTEPSDNRLFVVTNEGIWDCTTFDTPILTAAVFADPTGNAGHGVYAHYTDQSGEDFLYYADAVNGLWEYTESTGIWAQATDITGPDETKIAFVMVHKQRLWMIEQDSTIGWYLPIASNSGQATEFFFGAKFTHGGELIALINWSVDGGNGLDDYLVAVSSAGDVIPYQGADPSIVTGVGGWNSRGTYFIGKIPAGRRFFSEFSGELYLLSSFGLIAMSDLLKGVDSRDTSAKSLTFPIASILRQQLFNTSEELGWEPIFIPSRGLLIIDSPRNDVTGKDVQYVMTLSTEGWGFLRDVPSQVFAEWDNRIFFGDADNRVLIMDTPRDNVLIDQNDPLADGESIKFSLLGAYSNAGSPGRFKRGQMVRADFLSELNISFRSKILYDYQLAETFYAIANIQDTDIGAWDIGLWDVAVWGEGVPSNKNKLQGTSGMGRVMAVAIQGEAVDSAKLMGFDVMWIDGGPV